MAKRRRVYYTINNNKEYSKNWKLNNYKIKNV